MKVQTIQTQDALARHREAAASTYTIKHGRPSGHQSRAGHLFAATITLSLTRAGLRRWVDNFSASHPGEPIQITEH